MSGEEVTITFYPGKNNFSVPPCNKFNIYPQRLTENLAKLNMIKAIDDIKNAEYEWQDVFSSDSDDSDVELGPSNALRSSSETSTTSRRSSVASSSNTKASKSDEGKLVRCDSSKSKVSRLSEEEVSLEAKKMAKRLLSNLTCYKSHD